MGKLCRKVPYGPGAEELVNKGRKYLNYVETMPSFFGDPRLDEVYRNTLARRTMIMANGSTLKTTRGPINRSEAFAPSPLPVEPGVQAEGYFIALDAYDISGTSILGVVMFPLVFKDGRLKPITTENMKFYPASMAPGGVIPPPVLYPDGPLPVPTEPIITVSADEKYYEILGLFLESPSYIYKDAEYLPSTATGGEVAVKERLSYPTRFWIDLQNLAPEYSYYDYNPLWYDADIVYDHSGYLLINPVCSTPWSAADGYVFPVPAPGLPTVGSGYNQYPNPKSQGGYTPLDLFPPGSPPGLGTGIATLFQDGGILTYSGYPAASARHGVYFGEPGGPWENSYIYNVYANSLFQVIGSVTGTGEEHYSRRNTAVKRPGGPTGIVLIGPVYASRKIITEFSGYDVLQVAEASSIFGCGVYVNCTAQEIENGEEIEDVSDHGWISDGRQGFIVQRTIGGKEYYGASNFATRNDYYYKTNTSLQPYIRPITSYLFSTPIPALSTSGSQELKIDIHFDNAVVPLASGIDGLLNYGYDTMVNYYDFAGVSMFAYGFIIVNHTESWNESHATSFEFGLLFNGLYTKLTFREFAPGNGLPIIFRHPSLGALTTYGEFRLLQLGGGA